MNSDALGNLTMILGTIGLLFGIAAGITKHFQGKAEKKEKTESAAFDAKKNATSGILVQPEAKGAVLNDDTITIKYGQLESSVTRDELMKGYDLPSFEIGGLYPIKVKLIDGDKLRISGNLFDWDGKVVSTIEDNAWVLNNGNYFTHNWDDTGFEVVDTYNIFRIHIEFISSTLIYFEGFFNIGGKFVFVSKEGMYFDIGNITKDQGREWSSHVNPLFGKEFQKRAKTQTTNTKGKKSVTQQFMNTEPMNTGRSPVTSGARFTDFAYKSLQSVPKTATRFNIHVFKNDIESIFCGNAAIAFFESEGYKLEEYRSSLLEPPRYNDIVILDHIQDSTIFALEIYPIKNEGGTELTNPSQSRKYRNFRLHTHHLLTGLPKTAKHFEVHVFDRDQGSLILAEEARAFFEFKGYKFDLIRNFKSGPSTVNADRTELLLNQNDPSIFVVRIYPFK